mgnify:CR=1 FL=1
MNAPTRDHAMKPKASGGRLTPINRVICCQPCNEDKGWRPLWAWAVELKDSGDPRAERVLAVAEDLLKQTR